MPQGWMDSLGSEMNEQEEIHHQQRTVGDALAIPQHSSPGSPLKVRDAGDPSKGGRSSPQKEGRLKVSTQMRLAITLVIALRLFFGKRSQ